MNIKLAFSASYVLLDIQNTNFIAMMHYFIPLQRGEAIVSRSLFFKKHIKMFGTSFDWCQYFFKFFHNKVNWINLMHQQKSQ